VAQMAPTQVPGSIRALKYFSAHLSTNNFTK